MSEIRQNYKWNRIQNGKLIRILFLNYIFFLQNNWFQNPIVKTNVANNCSSPDLVKKLKGDLLKIVIFFTILVIIKIIC